jgi:hypothetical protein
MLPVNDLEAHLMTIPSTAVFLVIFLDASL